jgi:hypothetical protein
MTVHTGILDLGVVLAVAATMLVEAVIGDATAKAQAAAVKAVGEGTAGGVTTDYFGEGYEVTMTKSDGSKVEIHLDGSFNALAHPRGLSGGAPPPDPRTEPHARCKPRSETGQRTPRRCVRRRPAPRGRPPAHSLARRRG